MLRDAMTHRIETVGATSPESRGGHAARLISDSGMPALARWDQALVLRAQPCSQPSALVMSQARRPAAPPLGRVEHIDLLAAAPTTIDLLTGVRAKQAR
jgi:hypothetical protein